MFDWISFVLLGLAAFAGYEPVHEPFVTKIVDVHWNDLDGLAVEFFDRAI